MMEELVRFIAKNLVDAPDSVVVESREEGDTVVISPLRRPIRHG